jgi:hypothetical protein
MPTQFGIITSKWKTAAALGLAVAAVMVAVFYYLQYHES